MPANPQNSAKDLTQAPTGGLPSSFRSPWRGSRFGTAIAILVALAGALAAALRLLTFFGTWDDEGYMLVSLDHYIRHGHLYTQTFSQYGPFFYYAQGVFFQLLHLPVTHDMGRLVTLIYWVASSLLAALFVSRISGSNILACAGGLCGMLVGQVLTSEPGHPQQLVLLFYMAAAGLSLPALFRRTWLSLFLLGCLGAALVFTKVNIGGFYLVGLAHTLVCLLPSGRIRSIGIMLTLVYAASFPWLLMHAGFYLGFRGYCILATIGGIVTFAFGAAVRPLDALPLRAAIYSAAGLLTGTALIVLATSLQGMSMRTLLSGVVLDPLHHPQVFQIVLYMGRPKSAAAFVLTAGMIGLRWQATSLAKSQWLDIVRCIAGTGSILLLTVNHRIEWVLPVLPLTLIPQSHWKTDALALLPRIFITDMAVTQFLEPYPVAGSQLGIAAAPMILWAFLCLMDGVAGLRATSSRGSSQDSGAGLSLEAAIGGLILVIFAASAVSSALPTDNRFLPVASKLRGAAWLHLPAKQTTELESTVRNVSGNCSMLFSMPGMFSFNLWSGIPTPNGWNHNAWMKEFSGEQQNEILRIMQSDSQVCAIYSRPLARFWTVDDAVLATLPLTRYIMIDMPKVAQFGQYEIRVHPQRSSPWAARD